MGWIPFERALDPDQVKAVAADLATLGDEDIRSALPRLAYPHDSLDEEFRYVRSYLSAAQEFTADLADRGFGLVYLIG